MTDCLAEHLVRPVDFAAAVQHAYSEGVRVFVECGALDTLRKLTAKALEKPDVTTVPTLPGTQDENAALNTAIEAISGKRSDSIRAQLMNGYTDEEFDAFWAASSQGILEYVRSKFSAFQTVTELENCITAIAPFVVETQPGITRDALFRELAHVYANALEYPPEVFTEQVELEAELGIDSVKQTELLARVAEQYRLPERPADFRLSDYRTMGDITDFVYSMLPKKAAPAAPSASVSSSAGRPG